MAGINTLLSTLPPAGMIAGASGAAGNVAPEPQASGLSSVGVKGDSFEQGQWWKNRSQSADGEPSGQWREKAALKAYGAQSQNGLDKSGGDDPSVDASNVPEDESAEGKSTVSGDKETAPNGEALSREEQQVVARLRTRDVEVRAHEQAHLAAAGGYARGGASFQYQRGPDGQKYAVGGEVPIDVAKDSDPEKTIQKMNIVSRAALAPANPSGQDRRIAAMAASNISEAQRELATIRQEDEAARREGMAQQMDSAVNGRAGAAASEVDDAGSVSGGMHISMRRYGEGAANVGGSNQHGIDRVV